MLLILVGIDVVRDARIVGGKETQRIGSVPDIEIRPTLKGLRAGKDEVLDRAIEYIRTGR